MPGLGLGLGLNSHETSGPSSPAGLFALGEQGAWYDPSDLSTLWQDAAGTVPVTTAGQLVARIDDKSGNDNHATQATEASRPAYQTDGNIHWLDFDGTDDGMTTGAIDFSASDEMGVFVAMEKNSDTVAGVVVELSTAWTTNAGSFAVTVNSNSGAADYAGVARGNATLSANQISISGSDQPALAVVSSLHDISGDSSVLRINGEQVNEATGDKGAGNFGNYAMNIGARNNAASLYLDGNIYGVIVRGAASTAVQTSNAEAYLAAKSGVAL